jgi:hypothetical protein
MDTNSGMMVRGRYYANYAVYVNYPYYANYVLYAVSLGCMIVSDPSLMMMNIAGTVLFRGIIFFVDDFLQRTWKIFETWKYKGSS